jgi:hypothetical protein
MFPTNRARHDEDPDAPINHSTCAQSIHVMPDQPSTFLGTRTHASLAGCLTGR